MALFRVIPEGDLDLVSNPVTGKRELLIVTGAPYVRQKLASRFRFFLGEWFLDRREGVPWYRDVFVKNPQLQVIQDIFRKTILSVVEVASIIRFTTNYDPVARRLSFDFAVTLRSGETLTVNPNDRLFIIDLPAEAA